MIQVFLGCIIIALGIFCFVKYPMKHDMRALTLSALFTIISLVLKRFSIMIPLFGYETLRLGFGMLPLMIAGFMLKPAYCFMIGIVADVIGLILVPTGFPFLGFTLNKILTPLIPSLLCEWLHPRQERVIRIIVPVGLVLMAVASIMYIISLDSIVVSNNTIVLNMIYKLLLCALAIVVVVILLSSMYYMKKKFDEKDSFLFYRWVVCCIAVEIVVVLISTPLWLDIMYGVPFMLSLLIRIIKSTIMIPLNILVGYSVYRIINRF